MATESVDFLRFVQPGDVISLGQGCSEPLTLTRQLAAQCEVLGSAVGRLKIFLAGSFSGVFTPAMATQFDFASYGAVGDAAALARARCLDIFPVHYSQLPRLLAEALRPDIVLLQLSPADSAGRHSLGVANDYQLATARHARVVVAEVNARVPWTYGSLVPADMRIDHLIHSDIALVEAPTSATGESTQRIAALVTTLVPDGATLQLGMGSIMDAVCRALHSHRKLGIHSGVIGDGVADLMTAGVVDNSRKPAHAGVTVAHSLFGSRRLFDFAHRNPAIHVVETAVTHGAQSLATTGRLCAINSATEVDLTGQVNAEVSAGAYVGAVGGQMDFMRAAAQADGGLSIIALPSTAAGGKVSRIVAEMRGTMTTPRADVDCVVTEWGVAHLRGLGLRDRERAMLAIAHPEHREALQSGLRHL